jgi:two-component system nitrogen regulation response regulator GlnG/two-component system response regulator HydG
VPGAVPALVVAWSASEPERAGEALLLGPTHDSRVLGLGRYDPEFDYGSFEVARPVRQRPEGNELREPLGLPQYVSRKQLEFSAHRGSGVQITNIGKAAISVNGSRHLAEGESAILMSGDTLVLADQLLLICALRPPRLDPLRFFPREDIRPFGEPDLYGLVGESPAVWMLRDRLAFIAQTSQHVLVHGATGSGKELAAQAIHRMSARRRRPLVSHSAGDIPPALIEAELFGNRQDYPNPGTPGREGLIGMADQSTLFLDELGLLPADLQGKLLRVLDGNGEFRRLGVDEALRSDFRLVAATNRPLEQLKQDLLARLKLTVPMPDLNQHGDDIPLLAVHLLHRMAAREGERRIAERFAIPLEAGPSTGRKSFQISVALMDALVRHQYALNVRELEQLLLLALYGSPGEQIDLTSEVRDRLRLADRKTTPDPEATPCNLIEKALDEHGWNIVETARALGWSRFQLNRKMKKCGLSKAR